MSINQANVEVKDYSEEKWQKSFCGEFFCGSLMQGRQDWDSFPGGQFGKYIVKKKKKIKRVPLETAMNLLGI